jgi:uncharacterized damage-inducible protein DinB
MLVQLREAFRHHAWATEQLLDRCADVPEEELARHVPAIYGSALETFRHLVDADNWYLWCISGGEHGEADLECDAFPLADLRPVAEANAAGWEAVLQRDLDIDEMLTVRRKDGSASHATYGIRLAQVVHHGSDHRSQIATALTTLGHAPPEFDVWAYAWQVGLLTEDEPDPTVTAD